MNRQCPSKYFMPCIPLTITRAWTFKLEHPQYTRGVCVELALHVRVGPAIDDVVFGEDPLLESQVGVVLRCHHDLTAPRRRAKRTVPGGYVDGDDEANPRVREPSDLLVPGGAPTCGRVTVACTKFGNQGLEVSNSMSACHK